MPHLEVAADVEAVDKERAVQPVGAAAGGAVKVKVGVCQRVIVANLQGALQAAGCQKTSKLLGKCLNLTFNILGA